MIKVQQVDGVETNFAAAAAPQAMPTTRLRGQGLELLATLPVVTPLLLATAWPRWVVMWLLCGWIFAGCKWLTWRRSRVHHATWPRQLGYLFAWPGLDADRFLNMAPTAVVKPRPREYAFALGKLMFGLSLLFGIARVVPAEYPLVTGWVGMIGMIFILHFGSFHVLSCWWRGRGVDAPPLMNWPVLATSLRIPRKITSLFMITN